MSLPTVLSFMLFASAGSVIIAKPRNTAVVAGTPLVLECRAANNSYVRSWWVERFSDRQTKSDSLEVEGRHMIFNNWGNSGILTNSPNFSHFGAEVDAYGSGILFSNRSRLSDAGIYSCTIEVDFNIVHYSAEVTILHEIPQCVASFKEGDQLLQDRHIWLRCSVKCKGTWVPAIQWKHHRQEGKLDFDEEMMLDGRIQSIINGWNITSTLSVVIPSTKSVSYSYYSAMVYFQPQNRTLRTGAEMNPPSFTYKWTSPTIKVIPGAVEDATGLGGTSTDENIMLERNLHAFPWLALGIGLFVVAITVIVTTILCIRMKRIASESNSQISQENRMRCENVYNQGATEQTVESLLDNQSPEAVSLPDASYASPYCVLGNRQDSTPAQTYESIRILEILDD